MVAQCCAAGEIHTGTPAGRVEQLYGLDCYVASPPAGTTPIGAVIVMPDIFGWEAVNCRLLCDSYAAKGPFLVYLPELQSGMAFPPEMMLTMEAYHQSGVVATVKKVWHFAQVASMWFPFARVNTNEVVQGKLYPFLEQLRAGQAKGLPVGAAGFCWGGYWSFRLAGKTDKPLIEAAFAAHPSNMKMPDDIEAIEIPTSVAAGSIDSRFPKADVDVTREILERKTKEGKNGAAHEVVWYEGCHHGWALRGSKDDPEVSKKGIEAEDQAVRWFQKWFTKASEKA